MKELAIFICGMMFVSFVFPCLDSVSTWIQNIFGAKSVKLQVDTENYKDGEEIIKEPMGFHMSLREEDDED